ncbi:MAG: branched-chain amino acid ABC transporter permease [Symbiobacteriaceae bacterium]|nr:branched-chain amino acid ABC transporter permease [Symbiobacteriaceae bacterium]
MNFFIQQLITGISIGGIYALLAVAFALIASIFSFTNFAFGGVLMVSAFSGYMVASLGWGMIPSFIASIAAGVLISVIIELTAYRPMRAKGTSRLFLMISAMGITIFIENMMLRIFGANLRPMPINFPVSMLSVAGFKIGIVDMLSLATSCIALGILWWFLYKTRSGIAIRACASDTSTAGLMGIRVNRISLLVFAISGITAGISGFFFGLKYTVYPAMGAIAHKAFISSVIGGMGSLPGAVVGGFTLGILETFVSGYISVTFRDLFSYLILIIVFMFMPNGLLGRGNQDKI